MGSDTLERTDSYAGPYGETQEPRSLVREAAAPAGESKPVHWLRAAIDAFVRYVIRQQTAAARREIRRGKDRLSIRPDRN